MFLVSDVRAYAQGVIELPAPGTRLALSPTFAPPLLKGIKVYAEALKRYGTTDVPVDTFNKVWIVPEKATVYENKDAAFVVESKLKVMLETDYIAMSRADIKSAPTTQGAEAMSVGADLVSAHDGIAKNILREVIIPILEKEVNEER